MGLGENRAKRGLIFTRNRSVDHAVNWSSFSILSSYLSFLMSRIMDHFDDEDLDDPPSLIPMSSLPSSSFYPTSSSYKPSPSPSPSPSSFPSSGGSIDGSWAIVPHDDSPANFVLSPSHLSPPISLFSSLTHFSIVLVIAFIL